MRLCECSISWNFVHTEVHFSWEATEHHVRWAQNVRPAPLLQGPTTLVGRKATTTTTQTLATTATTATMPSVLCSLPDTVHCIPPKAHSFQGHWDTVSHLTESKMQRTFTSLCPGNPTEGYLQKRRMLHSARCCTAKNSDMVGTF